MNTTAPEVEPLPQGAPSVTAPEVGTPLQEAAPAPAKPKRPRLLQFAGIAFAVAVTVLIYVFRDQLREVGSYGYLGIFVISAVGNATIVLPVPSIVTAFAGGSVFNPMVVALVSAAGATLGELTGYVAGYSGKAIVENQRMYDRFHAWMQRYGALALFVLAAIPNPFFDIAGIIAGISRMPLPKYLMVTCAGKIVKFLVVAYLGAASGGLLEEWLGR